MTAFKKYHKAFLGVIILILLLSLLPLSSAIAAGRGEILAAPGRPSEYGYAPYFAAFPWWPDKVVGYEWGDEGTSVTLNIDYTFEGEEGSIEYTQTELVDAEGIVTFEFAGNYDLGQYGFIVHVTDGITTKTLDLPDWFEVYSWQIDLLGDTIDGYAFPEGSEVQVWPFDGGGVYVTATSDGAYDWTADFSGVYDIQAGERGSAAIWDADGDCTRIDWQAPPQIELYPEEEMIVGYGWDEGANVQLRINDPQEYYDLQTVAPAPWDPNQMVVIFDLGENWDLQAGDYIHTMDADGRGITSTVTALTVTGVNPETDEVAGTADPGSEVWAWAHASGEPVSDIAESGDWTVDLSSVYDVQPGDDGVAVQYDQYGNSTRVNWHATNPNFHALLEEDRIEGYEWGDEGTEVTLSIDRPDYGAGEDYSAVAYVGPAPWDENVMVVLFDIWNDWDLQPGDMVSLTDGVTTKTLEMVYLEVDEAVAASNIISGFTNPVTDVYVWPHAGGGVHIIVTSSDGGHWAVDFSTAYDIAPDERGGTAVFDADGDCTRVDWWAPNPHFDALPEEERVEVYWGTKEVEVTLNIDDPFNGVGVDYTESKMVEPAEWNPEEMYASFEFSGSFDLLPGYEVTVTDGVTSKSTVITELAITSVSPEWEQLLGTTTIGSPDVWVWPHGGDSISTYVDGMGGWMATFTEYDIQPGDGGASAQFDDDGDCTRVDWYVPNPHFHAFPEQDRVEGFEYGDEGTLVTLIVNGNTIAQESVGPAPWNPDELVVIFEFEEIHDMQPGDEILVTDNLSYYKTTDVTDLAVSGVNTDLNTVYGTAAAGSEVSAWAHDSGQQISTDADINGDWTADLSPVFDIQPGHGGVSIQCDGDGDCTRVDWYVPNPHFHALPQNDTIEAREWGEVGTQVTLTIDDPEIGDEGSIEYTETKPVAPAPWNPDELAVVFEFWETFDLLPGHVVTLTTSEFTKSTVITILDVTGADANTDTVSGTAEAGSQVWVWQHDSGINVTTITDGSGDWAADLSSVFDIQPGHAGASAQHDEDGDCTRVDWYAANPRIHVYPVGDYVEGNEFGDTSTEVTLTIDDPEAGEEGSIEYTDSKYIHPAPWNPDELVVIFELEGVFDLLPGHVVSLSGGGVSKSLVLTDINVSGINTINNMVWGTAAAGSEIWVWAYENGEAVSTTTDGAGDWAADLSPVFDIQPFTVGAAAEFDNDGDDTRAGWQALFLPPELISPENDITSRTPNFVWNESDGATSYYLLVEDDAFNARIATWLLTSNVCFDGTCDFPAPFELPFREYSWKVLAKDAAENESSYSDAMSFRILPPAVELKTPVDEATTVGTPAHSWNAIAGVTGYQLVYANDEELIDKVYTSPLLTGTSYTPVYSGYGTIYWSVRARGAGEDDWGDWAAAWQLTIQPKVPAAPLLLSPANKGATNDVNPTLDWSDVAYAENYRVTLASDKRFINRIVDEQETGSPLSEYTVPGDPLGDGPYYWKVQAQNSQEQWGAWSKVFLFNVDTNRPPKVLLSAPKDLSASSKTLLSFKWKALSKDSRTYTLQLCSNDDCSSVVWEKTNLPKAGYKMPKDQPGLDPDRYWWRVFVYDWAGNEGQWSNIFSFVVGLPKKPADQSATTRVPVFQWNKVKGATGYCLQVDNDDGFTDPVIDKKPEIDIPFTTTKYVATELTGLYDDYYWRVAADEGSGCGDWSATMVVYYTEFIPGTPVLLGPLNKAVIDDDTPTLSWEAALNANGYNVQVASDKGFANLEFVGAIDGLEEITTSSLANGTYYWRVQAYNDMGAMGKWSKTFIFTIATP